MRKFCLVLQFEQIKTQLGPTLTALADPHLECLKLNLKWQFGHSVCEVIQDL